MYRLVLLAFLLLASVAFAKEESTSEHRSGKLFLISTASTTTTTTLYATSVCYSSLNGFTSCTGKRKRAVVVDPISQETLQLQDQIRPMISSKQPVIEEIDAAVPNRKPKTFVYWLTSSTTTTSTSTFFFTTVTLVGLSCTPSNFQYASCG